MFEKALTLVFLNRTAPGHSPLKLLVSGAVSTVVMAFAVSGLIALLAAAGLYFTYQLLSSHDASPAVISAVIFSIFAFFLLSLLLAARACMRRISDIPLVQNQGQSPVMRQLNHLLSDFGDGLRRPPR